MELLDCQLVNFTKMTSGDIVVVLPNKDYFPYFFVVGIVSTHAKSILNSPQDIFHEVKILADKLPRDLIGGMFNHVRSTNSPVYDVSKIKYIESLIPKT